MYTNFHMGKQCLKRVTKENIECDLCIQNPHAKLSVKQYKMVSHIVPHKWVQ